VSKSKDLNLKDIWYIEFASSLNFMITFFCFFLLLFVVLFVKQKETKKLGSYEFLITLDYGKFIR
jgi:hypothetical protein